MITIYEGKERAVNCFNGNVKLPYMMEDLHVALLNGVDGWFIIRIDGKATRAKKDLIFFRISIKNIINQLSFLICSVILNAFTLSCYLINESYEIDYSLDKSIFQ